MLKNTLVDSIVRQALKEDVGARDLTTSGLVPKSVNIKADIEFKQAGVLCGIEIAERAFRLVNENIRFLPTAKDGEWIEKGREVAYIEGSGAAILIAERTALNFLARLSGIATKTRELSDKIKGTKAKLLDTRKTTPNLRLFEKYAVRTGGGTNHRFGLYDQALIKDNHLRILRQQSIPDIVSGLRKQLLRKTVVGLEVKNLMELKEALKVRVDYILLDNMSVEMVREAVEMRKKSNSLAEYEVSGGITLENIRAYAETGVERISSSAITQGATAIDISLDIVG